MMNKNAVRDITKNSSVQQPNRKAMNQLGRSGKSILDYGKVSPMNNMQQQMAGPNMLANLATKAK